MRNLLPKSKRLFSFLTLLILIVSSLLLIFFPKLVPIAKAQPSRLQYYGVDQAQPDEFAWLSQQGINLAMVSLAPDRSTWASYLSAAEANGIKLIIWPLGGCQCSASVPWCWTGSGWDLSAGEDALRYADEYVRNGGTGLLAVLSTHEPFWSACLSDPENQLRSLYSAMKAVAPNVDVYAYMDGLTDAGGTVTNGMADWAGVWLHCFGGVEGSCEAAKQSIRNDRAYIKNNNLNMKLLFAVQTFGLGGYQMPSYQELKDFTCAIIAEDNLEAVIYYPWRNPYVYTDILYYHYRDNKALNGIIRDVYDNCIRGLPSVSPTSTPTPGGPPSTPTPTPSGSSDYIVLKTDTPPVIDGNISEFDQANTISITQSSTGTQGTYKLLWDDNALYIACSVSDAKLNASISQEDGSLWTDDSIELMFDTLNNHGSSQKQDDYKFFVNLLNTHRDENMTNGTWDGPYTSAVILQGTNNNNADTDQGYTIEIRIPWSTLGLSTPSSNTTLGFDVVLNDKDASGTRNYTAWANTDGGTLNNPDGWNDIELSLGSDTNCPKRPQGDVNCDDQVNALDMKQLLAKWGPIDRSAPEDLDSNGRVNSLDAGRIIANWNGGPPASPTPTSTPPPGATPTSTPTPPPGATSTPTPTPGSPPTGGLDLYGVKFADNSDFNELKSLGVENPVVSVYSVSGLNSAITAAGNAGVKIIPWCWQTDPYGCYTLSGGSWSISDLGKEVLGIVNQEMAKGEASRVLAVYGNHEPYYHGQTNFQARALVTMIRNYIENELGQTYYLKLFGKIYSDVSCDVSANPTLCRQERDSFTDGICDYCGVMYHAYRANDSVSKRSISEDCPETGRCFRKNEMISNLNRDLNSIKKVPSGQTLNKFTPYLGIIEWPDSGIYGTGQYMPDPPEMLDGGRSIVNYVAPGTGYRADGFLWYTWANNAGWIGLDQYNVDGQRQGRMDVIRNVGRLR